jgi:hypothetical protein
MYSAAKMTGKIIQVGSGASSRGWMKFLKRNGSLLMNRAGKGFWFPTHSAEKRATDGAQKPLRKPAQG